MTMRSATSLCKVLTSVVVVTVAVLLGLAQHVSRPTPGVTLPVGDDAAVAAVAVPLTEQQQQDFARDGVLIVRSLLNADQVQALQTAIAEAPSIPSLFDFLSMAGIRFYAKVLFDVWRTHGLVAQWALRALPAFVAPLMTEQLQNMNQHNGRDDTTGTSPSFRLLRDSYFDYQTGLPGCGWHVDDVGFWPTKNDTAGITVWIALDDMVDGSGSLAIANQTSPSTEQLVHCRQVIRTQGTCGMEESSPACHAMLNEAQVQYGALQAGDAILWHRWVFHRTQSTAPMPDQDGKSKSFRRYSVRYIPGHARGEGALHASVSPGEPLDSPYYPQVWPALVPKEQEALQQGLASDISVWNVLQIAANQINGAWQKQVSGSNKWASKH